LGRPIQKGLYFGLNPKTPLHVQQVFYSYYAVPSPPNVYESRSNVNYISFNGYTSQAFPSLAAPSSVTYYDDYDFDYNGIENEASKFEPVFFSSPGYTVSPSYLVKGMVTGTKERLLTGGFNVWIYTYSFYDEEGKVIQVQKDYGNISSAMPALNGKRNLEIFSNNFDFSGKLITSEHRHLQNVVDNLPILVIKRKYDYDHSGRVLASYIQVGSQPETKIASYVYNEIGENTQKVLGNNLQTIDYNFDINGRLIGINEKKVNEYGFRLPEVLLSMNIYYPKLYNRNDASYRLPGKISYMDYSGLDLINSRFNYDDLGRITEGVTGAYGKNYNSQTSYDDNGNILSLNRNNQIAKQTENGYGNFGAVDQLAYFYSNNGNQLQAVEDAITIPTASNDFKDNAHEPIEYGYDFAGKITSDKNKGVTSISYNEIDLPDFFNESSDNYIANFYLASGEKVQSVSILNGSAKTTKYISGFVYIEDALQFIPHEEGRILTPQATGKTSWTYEYHYRDHLGSLVMSFYQPDAIPPQTATMEPTSTTAWSLADGAVRNNERQYSGNYSAKLTPTNPIGAWKTIKVKKGDIVTLDAYGSYSQIPTNNTAVNLISFVGSLPLQGTETGNKGTLLTVGLAINPIFFGTISNTVPKAYLEFMLTGTDNRLVRNDKYYISSSANNFWEHLQAKYEAEADGYLQVFVANESDSPVWFDDVSIGVQPTLVAQETHYDIWGVELAGLEKRDTPEDEYKFQGKELIEDLGLYEYDFGARYYDPQLGRWGVTDPANQFASGYMGMGNDPVNGTDPDGRWFGYDDLAAAAIGFAIGYVSSGLKTGDWGGKSLIAGGIGAVTGWVAYNTAGLSASAVRASGGTWTSASLGEFAGNQAIGLATSQLIPAQSIPIGNFSVGISPSFSTSGVGASIDIGYSDENVSLGLSVGFGRNSGTNDLSHHFYNDSKGYYKYWSASAGATIDNTFYGGTFGKNTSKGKTGQTIGYIGVNVGDFSLRVDEDYLGDGQDRWKTGGLTASYKINDETSVAFGLAIITGQNNGYHNIRTNSKTGKPYTDYHLETPHYYRVGALYGGIIYKGNAYFGGNSTEKRAHVAQNFLHDSKFFNTSYYFGSTGIRSQVWSFFGNYNVNTLVY